MIFRFDIDKVLFKSRFPPPPLVLKFFVFISSHQEKTRAKFKKLITTLSGITELKVIFDEEKLSVTKKRDEKLSTNRSDQSSGANTAYEGKQKSPLLSAEFYRLKVLQISRISTAF